MASNRGPRPPEVARAERGHARRSPDASPQRSLSRTRGYPSGNHKLRGTGGSRAAREGWWSARPAASSTSSSSTDDGLRAAASLGPRPGTSMRGWRGGGDALAATRHGGATGEPRRVRRRERGIIEGDIGARRRGRGHERRRCRSQLRRRPRRRATPTGGSPGQRRGTALSREGESWSEHESPGEWAGSTRHTMVGATSCAEGFVAAACAADSIATGAGCVRRCLLVF